MKFTLSWLKDHLDTTASLDDISKKLTAIGLEVEGIEDRAAALGCFKIAQIIEAEKHPQADRLRLCKVNTGQEILQVVCGAPNARAGIKVVLARVGDVIPSTNEALKLGKIRGEESQGMMCSAAELCLSDESEGIIEVAPEAPIGDSYAAFAGLQDPVIEINLTPNRGDCAGVRGIARDLAATGMGTLKPLDLPVFKGTEKSSISVQLDLPAQHERHCPLFVGRTIRNIKNVASPAWMQQRLRAIGLRPISGLVDITNYICVDLGRPLHVFDANKIKGNLWVRAAQGGEVFHALNDKEYILQQGMTIIGDDTGILSLAGVMGGVSSGCEKDTTDVFIESAWFDPKRIAQTGQALQINSDARYRFERGVDPGFVMGGEEMARSLIMDICATPETTQSEAVIVGEEPDISCVITYDPKKCLQRIGVDIPADEQETILKTLGFAIIRQADIFTITTPSWRPDVEGWEDITEEVIRIKGFEHIPALSMNRDDVITKTALDLQDRRANAARRALANQGLMEAVTWSFMPGAIAEQFCEAIDPNLRLVNPISADLDVMRPSILGNLILAARRNIDRGFSDVGLFEVGPLFRNGTPEGQIQVATVIRAGSTPRHWATPSRPVDVYDIKADALAALEQAGAPISSIQISTDAPAWFHPGRSGSLRLGPQVLGYFGEIHPAVCKACDIEGAVVGCELFLESIPMPRKTGTAKPLLKLETLQPVSRDFAFLVGNDVTADKLIKAIKGVDKNLIRDVKIFDIYKGKGIAEDKKSVALSITLQPTDHTLTEPELESLSQKVTTTAEKAVGAILRG